MRETYGHDFVFLTDWDISLRPFYHMRHPEQPDLTNCYDLIYNGVEISTGAQREHRIDVLVEQASEKGLDPEELEFYLDFFRYGVPPHGGFGMGLARVIMLMLNEHVDPRDDLPLPRPDPPPALAAARAAAARRPGRPRPARPPGPPPPRPAPPGPLADVAQIARIPVRCRRFERHHGVVGDQPRAIRA